MADIHVDRAIALRRPPDEEAGLADVEIARPEYRAQRLRHPDEGVACVSILPGDAAVGELSVNTQFEAQVGKDQACQQGHDRLLARVVPVLANYLVRNRAKGAWKATFGSSPAVYDKGGTVAGVEQAASELERSAQGHPSRFPPPAAVLPRFSYWYESQSPRTDLKEPLVEDPAAKTDFKTLVWEMLCGENPDVEALRQAIAETPPETVLELCASLDAALHGEEPVASPAASSPAVQSSFIPARSADMILVLYRQGWRVARHVAGAVDLSLARPLAQAREELHRLGRWVLGEKPQVATAGYRLAEQAAPTLELRLPLPGCGFEMVVLAAPIEASPPRSDLLALTFSLPQLPEAEKGAAKKPANLLVALGDPNGETTGYRQLSRRDEPRFEIEPPTTVPVVVYVKWKKGEAWSSEREELPLRYARDQESA